MKSTVELIKENEEYLINCGKHLFTRTAGRKEIPNRVESFYHVCLMEKDGIKYRVNISHDIKTGTTYVRAVPLDKMYWDYYPNKSELSDTLFPKIYKYRSIKQNKYLRERLDAIKVIAQERINADKENLNFILETEKSGS